MHFPTPLIEGTLLRRYKRFLADVRLESGEQVTAHCANPGSMLGLKEPGQRVWLSQSDNPKRKLGFSWELTEINGALVGINTGHPNKIVEEAIINGTITELQGYDTMQREVRYGQNSRIDILLSASNTAKSPNSSIKPLCYVEVKNVHLMREKGIYEFPDSVTNRGAKHLFEMRDAVQNGARAVMVYLIQRDNGETFRLANDIDPAYVDAFRQVYLCGVEAVAYDCRLSCHEISAERKIPIEFPK